MADEAQKPECMYGDECYRKNPEHLAKYIHKSPNKVNDGAKKNSNGEGSNKRKNEDEEESPADEAAKHSHKFHLLPDAMDEAAEAALKIQLAELVKDRKKFLRQMFWVEFPEDFYEFWEFCKAQKKDHPEKLFEAFGLKLVGPFDVLAGKFDEAPLFEPLEYLTHWRFYYDVPEFQTIIVKNKTEVHYGYWRDIPLTSDKCLIARNDSSKGCEMKLIGANIFQAVLNFLEHDFAATPFNKQQATKMKKSIEDWAKEKNISLTNGDELIKAREENILCRTLHRAGLVAPFDRKTKLGYRPLQESDATLKKIFEKFNNVKREDKEAFTQAMEGLHPVVTAADIAVDEKDTATALELGIDLFCSGHEALHELCKLQFITGYSALDRPQYIAIAKVHLENRRKGDKLDLIELKKQ